jgi:fucose 4-O-acetylase-like acetyltransferase
VIAARVSSLMVPFVIWTVTVMIVTSIIRSFDHSNDCVPEQRMFHDANALVLIMFGEGIMRDQACL